MQKRKGVLGKMSFLFAVEIETNEVEEGRLIINVLQQGKRELVYK